MERQHWLRSVEHTYKVIEQLHQARSADELCKCLLCYTSRFGATRLFCGLIPAPGLGRRDQMAHVLLDAWPAEWSQRYFSSGYLYRDPAILLVKSGCDPFLWAEIDQKCDVSASGQRIMREAAEFRLRQGLTLAFASLEGRPIGFSVAGEHLEPNPCQFRALQLLAAYAFSRAFEMAGQSTSYRFPVHLSPRQREALCWASEGLKPDEIGKRMAISSHTADMHLRKVREKLGVTSSIHAVAEAFRLGLIT